MGIFPLMEPVVFNEAGFVTLSSASRSITRIEGPPGSGKSLLLAREAVRLQVQDGLPPQGILLLAVSGANKKRLQRYLKQEIQKAGLAESEISVMTLDDWLLSLLNSAQLEGEPWVLLTELEVRLIIAELLQSKIQDSDLWYLAAQGTSLAGLVTEFIRQCQLQGLSPKQLKEKAQSERICLLAEVYESLERLTTQSHLITYPQLIQQVALLSAQDLTVLPQVLLIDEAQELSQAHYEFLDRLPASLVLAGNEKLSIRSYRGAQPNQFQKFFENQPVAVQVQQASMRGNTATLALLNGFLPQAVWEEQSSNLEQLKQNIQFGYYEDPEQEALALADRIIAFVGSQQVGNRPSQWEDCVVLLRSAHYKQQLVNAFTQREIPFFDMKFSDETLQIQRGLFDLLHIFTGWESLQLTVGRFDTEESLGHYWKQLSLSTADREAFIQNNNRYLIRWLETVVQDEEQGHVLSQLRQEDSGSLEWGLPKWLEHNQTAPVLLDALRKLIALYESWLAERLPLLLFVQAVRLLSPNLLPNEADENFAIPEDLIGFQDALTQLAGRYQKATGKTITLQKILDHYASLWDAGSPTETAKSTGVRLRSIHQVQGEEFAWVAIPFLVSGEFPYRREMSELLGDEELALLGLQFQSGISETEERRLLAVGMTRATHQLILTAHCREDVTNTVETVLPSPFYIELLAEKRRLLGNTSPVLICDCHSKLTLPESCDIHHGAGQVVLNPDADVQTESPFARYTGQSVWANLEAQQAEPVFDDAFVITTSPTAISTYMKCPRQYFYKHLLGLPEAGTVSASLGTLVHKVMEVFNSQTQPGAYTVERLIDLAEALFVFDSDPNRFHMAGYGERERRDLTEMSPLALATLRTRLLASIEDLKNKGYFDRYGSMKGVYAERELREVEIEGIERCRFKGKMDAVIQLADGNWEVVDYKTYGTSKYASKWDSCEKNFQKILEPLPDENGLSHSERFADKMSSAYPIDYQLPLYYLACRQDPLFQGKLEGISLQLVRPQFAKDAAQGAIRLGVSAQDLEAKRVQIVADIQSYIVDPLLGSQLFQADPASLTACGYCAYARICEGAQASDESGENA